MDRPSGSHQHTTRRPGPWGTDRRAERLYGYPPPRRDPFADLQERVNELELQVDALQGEVDRNRCECPD